MQILLFDSFKDKGHILLLLWKKNEEEREEENKEKDENEKKIKHTTKIVCSWWKYKCGGNLKTEP